MHPIAVSRMFRLGEPPPQGGCSLTSRGAPSWDVFNVPHSDRGELSHPVEVGTTAEQVVRRRCCCRVGRGHVGLEWCTSLEWANDPGCCNRLLALNERSTTSPLRRYVNDAWGSGLLVERRFHVKPRMVVARPGSDLSAVCEEICSEDETSSR